MDKTALGFLVDKNVFFFKQFLTLLPSIVCQNFKKYDFSLIVESKNIIFSLFVLKNHLTYNYTLFSCLSASDLLKNKFRFVLSYELVSLVFNSRLRLKLFTDEIKTLESATKAFINANWWEREIWDLFGLYFNNHPDLRRILTDYGFEGYPLRKDFPLIGFFEIRYDNNNKFIVSEPTHFTQGPRKFNYETPW